MKYHQGFMFCYVALMIAAGSVSGMAAAYANMAILFGLGGIISFVFEIMLAILEAKEKGPKP